MRAKLSVWIIYKLFKQYDATQAGKYGDGGEYTVQTGYGWTNGVLLDFISKYGNRM